ncbi:MAG: hypothetical protein OIF32_08165, partial [Campylobacterales bacterium]|nr:hypothetical protein [Campylobacterales bacterium]
IWEEQKVPQELYKILESIAPEVYDDIMNPPERNANVGQWCKKVKCWDSVKELKLPIKIDNDLLTDFEEQKYNKKESKKEKKLDSSIEIESFVINLKKEKWNKLLTYHQKDEMKFQVSTMQLNILTD